MRIYLSGRSSPSSSCYCLIFNFVLTGIRVRILVVIFFLWINDSGHSQDLVSQANSLLSERNYGEAKKTIDLALADSILIRSARTWYTKGRVYHEILKSRNPDLEIYKADIPEFVSEIVEAYTRTKQLVPQGNNLAALASNQLDILWADGINNGVNFYSSSNFQSAMQAFEISKITRPQDTTAYLYLGLSAQNAGLYERALNNYNYLRNLTSLSRMVHNGIITCTQANGSSLENQLSVIEDALFDYPDHIPYVIQEVSALVGLQRYDEAESRIGTVLARNPNADDLKLRQADLFDLIFKQSFDLGQPERSDRYFEKASVAYENYLTKYPTDFTANYNYAVMINEKANRYYVRINLMSKEEYELDGQMMEEQGHELTSRALPFMERARMINPQDEKTTRALRVFYQRLKMDEKLAALNN